jgi:hypothetical protein
VWKGDHLICESPWIGDDSWPVNFITFNFHFKFALCFKHVFPKLYPLFCVYVHQGSFHSWFGEDNFGKLAIIHLKNMFNLHLMQWHTIRMQMDYHWNRLVNVLVKVRVKGISLTLHFWVHTHFVPCVWHPWIFPCFIFVN